MAEVHRESEASKMKKASEGHEGKTGASKVAETSSSGKSEGKSESSSRVLRSGESNVSTLVSKKSESATTTVAKPPIPSKKGAVPKAPVQSQKTASKGASPSKKETVPKGTSPSKARTSPKSTVSSIIGSFAKWASPPKKKKAVKGSGSSAESDDSPDKKERSTTVSSGKRIKDTIKNVGNILFSSKSSKPSKSEEMHLVQPEAQSRHEDTSCLASKQTEPASQQTDPETWTPKYVEITGQENLYLRGELTASYETLHPTKTDTSSLSESVSLEVERASSLPLDREGSFEDASSLERDFEELSSPSKNIKGLKRIQTAIVEEEEDAMDSSNSPRKCRVVSQDADPVEKPSDIEMD